MIRMTAYFVISLILTTLPTEANVLYRIYSFGADYGHENSFQLNRDGSPVAGSSNCPKKAGIAPQGPWYARPYQNQYTGNGVSYTIESNGTIRLSTAQDHQAYGVTYIHCKEATVVTASIGGDRSAFWLNDKQLTTGNLNLRKGLNKLEFTTYNQNQGGRGSIVANFSKVAVKQSGDPFVITQNISGTITSKNGTPLAGIEVSASTYLDTTVDDGTYDLTVPYEYSGNVQVKDFITLPAKVTLSNLVVDTTLDFTIVNDSISISGAIYKGENVNASNFHLLYIEDTKKDTSVVTVEPDGSFEVRVPVNWKGTLLPYHSDSIAFLPAYKSYDQQVVSLEDQNFLATVSNTGLVERETFAKSDIVHVQNRTIHFSPTASESANLQLISLQGKVLQTYKGNANSSNHSFKVPHFVGAGMYLLNISSESGSSVQRIFLRD